MLRCYTLGRADEAAIDEVLAVEEQVLVVRPSALSNLSKSRRWSVSPDQSTDLVPPAWSPGRLKKRAFDETLSRGSVSGPKPPPEPLDHSSR